MICLQEHISKCSLRGLKENAKSGLSYFVDTISKSRNEFLICRPIYVITGITFAAGIDKNNLKNSRGTLFLR